MACAVWYLSSCNLTKLIMSSIRIAGFLKRLVPLAVLGVLPIFLSSCATGSAGGRAPLKTVAHVDLPRYMGDWYVIANVPYFAEKDCFGSIESYALRPDGRIDNGFAYHKGSFAGPLKKMQALAWVHNPLTNAEWRVRFFGLITAEYYVIDLDPKYQWTVVGHPSRNYGWIMARQKTLPEAQYQVILKRLRAQGYDPASFVKVPQLPPRKS